MSERGGSPRRPDDAARRPGSRGGRASLADRVAALEAERRREFGDAQREADTMFAQYQLSQLLASGDALEDLTRAVLAEIARASGAAAAGLWLAEPNEAPLHLAAAVGSPTDAQDEPPRRFAGAAAAAEWATARGWSGATLEERGNLAEQGDEPLAVGFVAVRPEPGGALDASHGRYLALVRRELAITFRAAQLRSSLARERATLAAILEGASDAIVAVDARRRLVRLNAAAAGLVGTAPGEGVGATCRGFLGCSGGVGRTEEGEAGWPEGPDALLCGHRCPFEEVLETGRPIAAREGAVRHRDGTVIPVSGSFAPMAGRTGGAVAVIRDLRASQALDELKSSFVAAVSHELRTPLALIDGYAQSLLHLELDEATRRRHLERIGVAVERLTELVDQIIDISQLESDRLALRRGPVDLAELVGSFAAEQADLPGTHPIRVAIPRELPAVDADPARLRQVLANLTANTAKYAGPEATISIRARRHRDTVVVTVADDGAGIDLAERDHVFERFWRGGRVRESRVPGSGLGLYLCRRLVEAHGGWIRLDATTRGTSVSFAVPVAPEPDAGELLPPGPAGRRGRIRGAP